jgi:hypothetical protein
MPLDYPTASDMLARGRKGRKRLGNNTFLHRIDPETLAVRLHETDVVLIHSDGTYTLDSGGWRTVTTKDRMARYSPGRIGARDGAWFVGSIPYHDGIKIGSDGDPIPCLKPALLECIHD